MTGVLDLTHRYRLNAFDVLVPDGQPVRWALNKLHRVGLTDRVYGPTLMLKVCERAAAERLPIYLYGGTEEMVRRLIERLTNTYPALTIAGSQPSAFRRLAPDERDEANARIRASGAAITFVGLGCPRQEVWAFECRDALSMPVVAIGAAFAFHAGMLPQAPRILQDRGLEWLYRLMQEPKRLWRRYLFLNPLYLTLVALQAARLRLIDPQKTLAPREELRYG
jgi:exopolysaccharide biosynthesis WecB/TagA/CpsF family protein